MGVVNRPAIVRGFLKSLHAIDLEHIRSTFRELYGTAAGHRAHVHGDAKKHLVEHALKDAAGVFNALPQ
jgi:hypothetical protein